MFATLVLPQKSEKLKVPYLEKALADTLVALGMTKESRMVVLACQVVSLP